MIATAYGRRPSGVSESTKKREFRVPMPKPWERERDPKTGRPLSVAAQVRNRLLRDHFGLSDEEITEFVAREKFYLRTESGPSRESTDEEARAWSTDAQGNVKVNLAEDWVRAIEEFRQDRARRAVNHAASGISDPTMREVFAACIQGILNMEVDDRRILFTDLVNYAVASKVPPGQVIAAIEALERESRFGDNPYLAMIKARLALQQYQTRSGPGYDAQARRYLAQAVDRMSRFDLADAGPGGAGVFGRGDAALVNGAAQYVANALGDTKTATNRDWIQRFLAMTPAERNGYEEGDLVDLIGPGERSMRGPNAIDRRFKALMDRWAMFKEREAVLAKIGAPKVKNADRENSLTRDVNSFTHREVRSAHRKKVRNFYVYVPERTRSTEVPFARASRVNAYKFGTGLLAIAIKVLEYLNLWEKSVTIANYFRDREQLEQEEFRRRFRVVPPKPRVFREAITAILEAASKSKDVAQKEEFGRAIEGLRVALEESMAAWPGL